MSSPKGDRDVIEDRESRSDQKEERKETRGAETQYDGDAEETDRVEHEHKSSLVDEDERRESGKEAGEDRETGPSTEKQNADEERGVGRGEVKEPRDEARGEDHEGRREGGEERRDAEKADGEEVRGKERERNGGSGPSDEQGGSELVNLFVRNVAKHVIEEQLVVLFSKFGKVDSAVVVRDPHSRECRGFGFVKMLHEEEAAQAIEALRDFEFEGRRIAVEKAKRKAPHSRTPGEYMGIDRRIRDRYSGMKRSRGYGGYEHGDPYGMDRRGGYGGRRHESDGRGRYDDRGWDPRGYRPQPMRPSYDGREQKRGRYEGSTPYGHRGMESEHRLREREPPVPREPADDCV
ncbi:transformer-SR ribonucleoprotein, putative [Chondrus crispus]|uniref:Transformer-SR ribonucleoprotein, putative n=1 Tax=Chondrus crispus TaxID=2769 RepID=R7Q2D9_CHOCR|nr:transformer-SR ribonucleoprotein, putative [Chondrus crispus]CDF32757.1 transformer-SR ribonucleoprotein, putative [Chondrus crispus]|eukprot:XP_005712558.1 transformer-SR ribonucleoprotein, putative [Chondrus crispus]